MTTESPLFGRAPGDAYVADDFDPAEIAGMRTAAWILFTNAAFTLLGSLLGPIDVTAVGIPIDVLLGVQLLRLRHSWRAWAMLRAAVGVLLGMTILIGGLFGSPVTGLMGVGVMAYSASILLVLYARPTMQRVYVGRATFAVSLLLLLGSSVAIAVNPALATLDSPPANSPETNGPRAAVSELSSAVIGGANVIVAGPTGGKLASEDLFNVAHFIEGAGTPWLIIGHWPEGHRPSDWPVDVFFEPDVTAPGFRLGNARSLLGTNAFAPQPNDAVWQVVPVRMRYAQVLVDDEHPTFIGGDLAFNRPFLVHAAANAETLAQDDIVAVARLIRSSPMGRHVPVKGNWPIYWMAKIGQDSVQVILLDPASTTRSGQQVFLSAVEGTWQVEKVSSWGI